MAADESPVKEPATSSTRGRGRGGRGSRGGRGKGPGRSAPNSLIVKATASARGGRGGAKRGRGKTFTDSRVQAAHERQRDLKSSYASVAWALRNAIVDLAERNIEEILQDPQLHKKIPGYQRAVDDLRANLKRKTAQFDSEMQYGVDCSTHAHNVQNEILRRDFIVSYSLHYMRPVYIFFSLGHRRPDDGFDGKKCAIPLPYFSHFRTNANPPSHNR